ncbi:MAG: ABC transporter ATP-binding protein [Proteobacteria bacterium]|nr:ABC transporter ATP-binding protein [Pseudomonadota bacterium]
MTDASSSATPSARKGSAITLAGVTKVYGEERVVDGVDLSIRPGEFCSLLGPSGSGKTTTLMMIAGFAGIDAGRIELDGKDIAGIPPNKRGFGLVFQNYAIFPHLNVFENVAFPLRARGWAKEEIGDRVTQALRLVRLERFAASFSRQLSGGQQQRVAIARAIVFEPSVVLMDEPLGALDKNLRYEMQTEIKEIQKQLGMTVVYVTHDQEEAMNLSDRIAIMNAGRIVQAGSPRDVYERPADRFVGRFLGEANLIPGAVTVAAGEGQSVLTLADGRTLRAVAMEALTAGAGATLFIRPEQIELAATQNSADPDINQLSGRIETLSFLGNTLRYMVRVADDLLVMVERPNNGRDAIFAAGTAVTLRWRAAQSLLLMR